MKEILLTKGYVAVVDDEDFEAVNKFSWHIEIRRNQLYARRRIPGSGRNGKKQYLHRFLLPDQISVDHHDGDGLNNRRENIRPATHQQNQRGFQRKRLGATSKFRGVSWCPRDLKWISFIRVNGKSEFLGRFENGKDAARAYDIAARKYFGEFATPNFL